MNFIDEMFKEIESGIKEPILNRNGIVRFCVGHETLQCLKCEHLFTCKVGGRKQLNKNEEFMKKLKEKQMLIERERPEKVKFT